MGMFQDDALEFLPTSGTSRIDVAGAGPTYGRPGQQHAGGTNPAERETPHDDGLAAWIEANADALQQSEILS